MMGKAAKKVMLVGRATTFMVGLAVILALTVGLASTALAGTGIGARLDLGKTNTVNAVTKLVGSVAGPSLQIDNNSTNATATALDLQVEPGKAPMKVNSEAKVANLNADKLDGKSEADFYAAGSKVADSAHADQADSAASAQSAQNAATLDGKSANEVGVNGLERVMAISANDSDSPKALNAICPAGKVVVGSGYNIQGGTRSMGTDQHQTDISVTGMTPSDPADPTDDQVFVTAHEEEPTSGSWILRAFVTCATAP
jgi:hypothetical protein